MRWGGVCDSRRRAAAWLLRWSGIGSCRAFMAWRGCPWLELDIKKLREEIASRHAAYSEGRRAFRRGGTFSSSAGESQLATRRFGEEREKMRVEERKIKELEERLDFLIRRR
eukprot:gnl/TRDRNA2_/TRDRNA2_40376_c0_seq1.p3 gnl/TRDRNA2_/TRDRNA2_40376_c0~~gnl/TRDRNA2_/TRDRNA2_40376_c0_seq1.p3  ORF type:complete len:112 (-),score=21.28 gnl/TRDRNA2_/TRDRNA2_40376_c0_seq1:50-385(-)